MLKAGSKVAKTLLKPSSALRSRVANVSRSVNVFGAESLVATKKDQLYYTMTMNIHTNALTSSFYRSFASQYTHKQPLVN